VTLMNRIILAALILASLVSVASAQPVPFATGGGLKMLYDNRMYPQAIEHQGKVHIVWRGIEGYPYLVRYDREQRTFSESTMLLEAMLDQVDQEKYRGDHHFAPVIWLDESEHWHVVFGCHNSPGVQLISASPRETSAWVEGPSVSDSASYPKIHRVGDSRTLVYFRHTGHLGAWQYRLSSDGGRQWDGEPFTVVDMNAEPQDGFLASHAGSYNTTRVSADGKRLHVAFIWKVEEPVFNRRYGRMLDDHTQRYNLYYFYFDLASRRAFNIDGVEVALPLRKSTADAQCLVWDTDERVASVGPSIALDDNDRPYFVLPVSEESPYRCHFYFVRRQGDEWQKTALAETLHPFNASQLIRAADGSFRAYLITGSDESIDERGLDEYGYGRRVELWQSDRAGDRWKMTRDVTPVAGLKYQNVKCVYRPDGEPVGDLFLFYSWDDSQGEAKGWLWDMRTD